MITIAETMLQQAQVNNEYNNSLSTVVFCAFSLEGFLNHVGEELVKDWNESFESYKPKDKLLFLANKFNIEIDFGKSPFQSFKIIFEIRNQLSHPKTKEHIKDSKFKLKVNENSTWNANRWECYSNKKEAKQILHDTKKIIDELDQKFPIEKIPCFILSEHI